MLFLHYVKKKWFFFLCSYPLLWFYRSISPLRNTCVTNVQECVPFVIFTIMIGTCCTGSCKIVPVELGRLVYWENVLVNIGALVYWEIVPVDLSGLVYWGNCSCIYLCGILFIVRLIYCIVMSKWRILLYV